MATDRHTIAFLRCLACRYTRFADLCRSIDMPGAVYTLTQLNQHIRQTLEDSYPDPIWISAEIASFNRNSFSGHCYLELSDGDAQTAKSKAMIWKKTFDILSPRFQIQTGTTLQKGLRIQVLAKVEFSVQYGLSLVIWDIDTDFTIGEIARKRALTLRRLEEQGFLHKNKTIELPVPAQRIAVVSSPTAAGYQDFLAHLTTNINGFAFAITLFSAQMQGEGSLPSLQAAFADIANRKALFDVVVVIRGGGSSLDLLVFDTFEAALCVANCPLPVFTGIGHERDESVCDVVAHGHFKTPTAVAEWFLNGMLELDALLTDQMNEIAIRAHWNIQKEMVVYQDIISTMSQHLTSKVQAQRRHVDQEHSRLKNLFSLQIQKAEFELERASNQVITSNPIAILKKGYARIFQNGRKIVSRQGLDKSLVFEVQWQDGAEHVKSVDL